MANGAPTEHDRRAISAPKAKDMPDWNKPTNKSGLEALAPLVATQLERGLPKFMAGQADRLIRCMITEVQRTPQLLDCSPLSLFSCTVQAGQLGLEIGAALGHAYLIPFKKTATLVVGYKGMIKLAFRSDRLLRVTVREVHEADEFIVVMGTDQKIIHRPNLRDPGPVAAYYAECLLQGNVSDFEVMTKPQVEAHRNKYALSKGGSWATSFDEMAKKTPLRRLLKRVPTSVEAERAASFDETSERGDSLAGPRMILAGVPGIPEIPDAPEDRLRERLEEVKRGDPADPESDPFGGGQLFPGEREGVGAIQK